VAGLLRLKDTDPPFFLLASATLGSVGLFVSRSIPTLHVLLGDERQYYAGDIYISRAKSVIMPALMALALLLFVVLIMLVLGVGLVGTVEDISQNTFLLGVVVFIGAALGVSLLFASRLARSEDRVTMYRPTRSAEVRNTILLGAGSGIAASACALVGALLFLGFDVAGLESGHWTDFFAFALLAALGPYGFYVHRRHSQIKRLEERFPDFLRDIAASRKAGLTLTSAVSNASRGDYGALSPEIRRMADQLSWDVPFEECLAQFAKRVRTPLIQRSVSLIIEASRSGGNVTDVVLAAAADAREIKNLETERRTTMGLYTMVIYITFFVFLAVVAVLYATFIPEIVKSGTSIAKSGGAKFAGLTIGNLTMESYRVFYFLAAVMQGLGNGFVAGTMGSGRVVDGMRHSFAMVAIAYVTFTFVIGTPG
jgi:flagellar protein FlaJ